MASIRKFWNSMFDIRRGEYLRTICMTLYLMTVLFAYYILKPVSRAIFLNQFDIDKLPWLYVLIAAFGGVFAFFYTKLAVKSSLRRAVDFATLFSAGAMVAFWWLIQLNIAWIVYAFNIWVSLFSIILVSQGWLIAANIFTTREAKRLYGILGVGSVIGAAFGGTFTAFMVRIIGPSNLILACAGMVLLSYLPFLGILAQKNVNLARAKAAESDEEFSFGEIVRNLRSHRHLQVIMAIMMITFVIDVMVEFQFNAMAKQAYHNKVDLTAFLGNFYGFWLNLVTFVFQFFMTGFIVSRFGVGGTLQIMPMTIAAASLATVFAPGIYSTAATRLAEASTRYSFNKTGMELLYLPLPLELRNRTKAFVDVFVDRLARGVGGMLLVFFTSVIVLPLQGVALVVLILSALWIVLSVFAKREYIDTVRKRLDLRRLDLESGRISMEDPGTVALLEQTAGSPNPRQATYALSLLATAPGYPLCAQLKKLMSSDAPEVRARVFELGVESNCRELRDAALEELRGARQNTRAAAIRPAVRYALETAEDRRELAARLLSHPNADVNEGVVEFLASHAEMARELLTREWLSEAARSDQPQRRRLAAIAIGARGDTGTEALHTLLADADVSVTAAACLAAAQLENREYVPVILRRLSDPRLRGAAIQALASFGDKITGSLGDLLLDGSVPEAIRRQIPRVLRHIQTQRSVDALRAAIGQPNLALRAAVLRALNRLRENAPTLDYGSVGDLTAQVLGEARFYFELSAALAVFCEIRTPHTAAGLLVSTLEQRLAGTLERLFRLLGLRYPPRQIYAVYLAVHRRKSEQFAAALEFLDNVLDKELKRIVVPLLDDPGRLDQRGRDLFGITRKDPETALRELLESEDEWLVACAMATAAQLGLKRLAPDIKKASAQADGEVSQVARDAIAVLA